MLRSAMIAGCLLIGGAVQTTQAQTTDPDLQALLACQAITDDAARLKCLDEATRKLAGEKVKPAQATPTTPEPAAPTATPVAPVSPPATVAATESVAAREALEAERAALAAERAALEAERAEIAAAKAKEEEDSRIPIWARLQQGLVGSDGEDVPDEYNVSVTKITRNGIGRHFFYTDDGLVWEQVGLKDFRPPRALPATGRIKKAALGSQWLFFDDKKASGLKIRPRQN
ncbi:MAG: hypothetical protein AAFX02_08345 [Pseudomonadota bacterium]